jgi:hypothetical protein
MTVNLPDSISHNTFGRVVTFLNESNRIEGITALDYASPKNQTTNSGHFGAFILSQKSAEEHEPLTIRKIKDWQKLITTEQKTVGVDIEDEAVGHIRSPQLQKNVRIGNHIPPNYNEVPTLLDALVEDINEKLRDPETLKDDASYCRFLGEAFQRFESIHPFVDGNGRVGRLIANYIATYAGKPLIVFKSEYRENNIYYKAHESPEAMAVFMAFKVQEAVFGINGQILIKRYASGLTGHYESIDGKTQEDVEWHPLFKRFKLLYGDRFLPPSPPNETT